MKKFLLFLFCLTILIKLTAQKAVDFSFTTPNGQTYSLYNDFLNKGKTVVVDIFFTTCPPCNTLAPSLQSSYELWGEGTNNVEFISLSNKSFDNNQKITAFDLKHGLTFPSAGAEGGSLDAITQFIDGTYGTFTGTPLLIVISANGDVNYKIPGGSGSDLLTNLNSAITAALVSTSEPILGKLNIKGFSSYVAGIKLCNSPIPPLNSLDACFNNSPLVLLNPDGSFSLKAQEYGFSTDNLYLGLSLNLDPTEIIAGKNINTLDIILATDHILGKKSLNPLQRIAADVNCSQSITASDLVQIRQVILQLKDEFSCSGIAQFTNVQKYAESNPDSIYQFNVARKGDVSGAKSNANGSNETRDNNPVKLQVDNQFLKPDQNYKIDFYLDNQLTTKALQFTLETHPSVTITKFYEGLVPDIGKNNFNLSSDGKTLTLSWNTNGQPLPTKLLLFSLLLHSDIAIELSKAFSLTSKIAVPEAYDEDGTVVPLNLNFIDKSGGNPLLIQFGPNPVTDRLNFSFSLPEETNLKLFATDVLGRTSPLLIDHTYSGGNHFESFEMGNLTNGIYQFTLLLNGKVQETRQILIYR